MNRLCKNQSEIFAEFRRKIEMLITDYTHSQNNSHKLYEELYSNYHLKRTEIHIQQSISDEIASKIRKIIVHEYSNPKWFDMLVTRRSNFQIKDLNITEFVRKELMILTKEIPEYYSSILHEIEFQNRTIPEAAELFGLTKEEMEKSWIEARYCLLDLLLRTNCIENVKPTDGRGGSDPG